MSLMILFLNKSGQKYIMLKISKTSSTYFFRNCTQIRKLIIIELQYNKQITKAWNFQSILGWTSFQKYAIVTVAIYFLPSYKLSVLSIFSFVRWKIIYTRIYRLFYYILLWTFFQISVIINIYWTKIIFCNRYLHQ